MIPSGASGRAVAVGARKRQLPYAHARVDVRDEYSVVHVEARDGTRPQAERVRRRRRCRSCRWNIRASAAQLTRDRLPDATARSSPTKR